MPKSTDPPVSMQVVLRAASGQEPDASTPITAATISAFLPDPAAAQATRRHFQQAGFEVGEVVGNSFSITAPAATFHQALGARVRHHDGAVTLDGTDSRDVPLRDLPDDVRHHVSAITLPEPPDFGPTSY